MDLAQPYHLWWLLLIPLLYLLSRPPRPRRTELTAHLAQWLAASKRLRRRPVRFRWLRFLMLLMAFVAVVLAHADPRRIGNEGPDQLVVLLDRSASMAAHDFDATRREVLQVIESLPGHIDVRLGLAGRELQVVRGSREDVLAALRRVEPEGAGVTDFETLAAELVEADTAVWTVTDGLGAVRTPGRGALSVRGQPAGNTAIIACTVEDRWPLPEVHVVVKVMHAAGEARPCVLRAEGSIAEPVERRVELSPGAVRDVAFDLQRGKGGRLRIRIVDAADPLPVDDKVDVDLPPPPEPEIAIRSDGAESPTLRAAARALAAEVQGTLVEDATRAGFLLMSGGQIEAIPEGARMISFGTSLGRGPRFLVEDPKVTDWNRSDPVTAGLDLSDLRIRQALSWPTEVAGLVLLQGDQGPLAVLQPRGDGATVHLAFRLEDSNLGQLAAFPQFVRRAFARAYGAGAQARVAASNLLDPAESTLRSERPPQADRALPAFAEKDSGLAVWMLLSALVFLAIRAWV